MNTIKYFIFLLLSIPIVSPLEAHFDVYQEWYNPKTGQILEAFGDYHTTADPHIQCLDQHRALLARAIKIHHVLVVVEDNVSHLSLIDDTSLQKIRSDSSLPAWTASVDPEDALEYKLVQSLKRLRPLKHASPLRFLYAHCLIYGIPAVNIECRSPNGIHGYPYVQEQYKKEIDAYDDGPELNTLYKNIQANAAGLSVAYDTQDLQGFYGCLAVDARALHAIVSCTNKHIILAAGEYHIKSINSVLMALGWQQRSCVVPSTLCSKGVALFKANYIQTKPFDILSSYKSCSRPVDGSPEDASACLALAEKHFQRVHALNLETIALNPKLLAAPRAFSDAESKLCAAEAHEIIFKQQKDGSSHVTEEEVKKQAAVGSQIEHTVIPLPVRFGKDLPLLVHRTQNLAKSILSYIKRNPLALTSLRNSLVLGARESLLATVGKA